MTQSLRMCSILLLALLVAACTPGQPIRGKPQIVASPDKTSLMLAEAADRASTALETLASVEQARTPSVAVAPIDNAPVELKRAITVNWVGPVEPISKTLADRASYTFRTIGTPPPVPLVVNIDVENKPVIEVLRSIGLQLGQRADLHVNAPAKVIELHYAPNTGQGE